MSTLTPNYGLIVPEATDTVAQVRADYATNLGIIDNISGGGGGGGGNVYGAFVNTNRIIASGTYTSANPLSYTATEDCYIYSAVSLQPSTGGSVRIDGELVGNWYNGGALSAYNFEYYLRRGQTLTATQTYSGTTDYAVYGLIQGTESIFTPIIYSDNERMIGIWRDNKPLYQKTLTFVGNINANTTNNFANVSALNIDTFVSGLGNGYESGWGWEQLPANLTRIHYNPTSGYIELVTGAIAISGTTYITIQYTKTTDTAGSGNWNTDGIPMVHYSTTEQVIGTWVNGKTLYQISYPFNINIGSGGTTTIATMSGYEDITSLKGCIKENNIFYAMPELGVRLDVDSSGNVQIHSATGSSWRGIGYLTVEYTKSS